MSDAAAGEKLKVFISYSRRDSAAFADELVAGLELAGFAPFLDRHDIAAGEDWEARLGGLITQSDTVVFVVSLEAVKSDRCAWEVDRTIELSKRLLPVIFKSVPDHDTPEKLRRLQFIRFDGGAGFAERQRITWNDGKWNEDAKALISEMGSNGRDIHPLVTRKSSPPHVPRVA